MHANYLDTLDWGILIAYFLILIGIGIWASLKRKKGSSLFLAERSLKWHHIGFSMWGTNVGPSMLIASASAGFTTGIVSGNYAWYAFVFICLYNPQNEMFRLWGTKRSFSQNETFFFSHPYPALFRLISHF